MFEELKKQFCELSKEQRIIAIKEVALDSFISAYISAKTSEIELNEVYQKIFVIKKFIETQSNLYANSCRLLSSKILNGNMPNEYYMLHDINIIFNKITETFGFKNMTYFNKFTKELAILDEIRRINNE